MSGVTNIFVGGAQPAAAPQKPSIGRIVHYYPMDAEKVPGTIAGGGNAAEMIAAVIVAVWSDSCVNLKLITDGPADEWRTSVMKKGDPGAFTSGVWDWPPKG